MAGNTGNFNSDKANAFAERFLGVLNDAALCMMVSIGHRTRLFDALSHGNSVSLQEIASSAGLNERYVREWLGAKVTGGVIEADAETRKFRFPKEHAAFLTRAAGADNLAFWFPLLVCATAREIRDTARWRS